MTPQARQDSLLVQEVGDELVVYDQERHRAHRLNQTAALIWRHCDGQKTAADMASLLHDKLSLPADEDLVWMALTRLDKAHLLQEPIPPRPADGTPISRRQLIRKLGLAGSLVFMLPVVTSMVSPTVASTTTPPVGGKGGGDDDELTVQEIAGITGAAGAAGLLGAGRGRRGCRTNADCPASAPYCVDVDPQSGYGRCSSQGSTLATS